MEQLLVRDWSETLALIWEILQDPASRPTEAMLVFAVIAIVLLVLMISGLLIVAQLTEDDELDAALNEPEVSPDSTDRAAVVTITASAKRRIPQALTILGVLLLWWLATGVGTMNASVCQSCHAESNHSLTSSSADPHETLSCVKCHESGGSLGSLTLAMPARTVHVVSGLLDEDSPGYGYVSSSSCMNCHADGVARTLADEAKAVKISHREPMEAGAQCLDCHPLRDGVVGPYTTQMTPCLRCHDGVQAPAECSYCHTGDISLAITGRSQPTTATAERLVPNPDCDGCHSQERCDACHGIRLPHTEEFMDYAHAREGVEDIWYNAGKTCGKCHNEDNRPCTECHQGRFPSHGTELRLSHRAANGADTGCDSCHASMAYRPRRDFCVDLCHQAGSQ